MKRRYPIQCNWCQYLINKIVDNWCQQLEGINKKTGMILKSKGSSIEDNKLEVECKR